MVWGWIGVSIVSLMIAASLAELCSAWPHAAGARSHHFPSKPPLKTLFVHRTGILDVPTRCSPLGSSPVILDRVRSSPCFSFGPLADRTNASMFNVFGAWAIMAAGTFILSNQVLGLALSYNPDYIQQPSHLVGVYLGLLFCFFLCNVRLPPFFLSQLLTLVFASSSPSVSLTRRPNSLQLSPSPPPLPS